MPATLGTAGSIHAAAPASANCAFRPSRPPQHISSAISMGCAPHSTSGCDLMRKQVASVRHSGRKGCQATWAHLPGVVPAEVPLAAVILHKDAVLDADKVCLAAACAQGHACTVNIGTAQYASQSPAVAVCPTQDSVLHRHSQRCRRAAHSAVYHYLTGLSTKLAKNQLPHQSAHAGTRHTCGFATPALQHNQHSNTAGGARIRPRRALVPGHGTDCWQLD